MTLLEQVVTAVRAHPTWALRIPPCADVVTCNDWGRKGGSHYKNGQFDRK